jgi:uncharacterized integral membrane protein
MKYFYTFLLTILIAGILTFILQNNELVVLKFLFYKTNVFSGVMILSSVVLGIALTFGFLAPKIAVSKYRIGELERDNLKLKEKIKNETINFESDGLGSEGTYYKEKK